MSYWGKWERLLNALSGEIVWLEVYLQPARGKISLCLSTKCLA